jgi:transposase-like protein
MSDTTDQMGAQRVTVPDPEVAERARRRSFSASYKLEILEAADRCSQPGEIGKLLRREGLYSAHLSKWRKQRDEGVLAALSPKRRGRKPRRPDPSARRIAELERDNARLQRDLRKAQTIIEVQKKLSEILGIELPAPMERS